MKKLLYIISIILFTALESSRVWEFYNLVSSNKIFSGVLTLSICLALIVAGIYHSSILAKGFIITMVMVSFIVSINEMIKETFVSYSQINYKYSCNHPKGVQGNCIDLKECNVSDYTNKWSNGKWIDKASFNKCKADYEKKYMEVNSLAGDLENRKSSSKEFNWIKFLGLLLAAIISSVFFPLGIVVMTSLLKSEIGKPKMVEFDLDKEACKLLAKGMSYKEISDLLGVSKTKVFRINEKYKIRTSNHKKDNVKLRRVK
jgi:hypothetical protein